MLDTLKSTFDAKFSVSPFIIYFQLVKLFHPKSNQPLIGKKF